MLSRIPWVGGGDVCELPRLAPHNVKSYYYFLCDELLCPFAKKFCTYSGSATRHCVVEFRQLGCTQTKSMHTEVAVAEYFSDRTISLGGAIFVRNAYSRNGCGKFRVPGCEAIPDLSENTFRV